VNAQNRLFLFLILLILVIVMGAVSCTTNNNDPLPTLVATAVIPHNTPIAQAEPVPDTEGTSELNATYTAVSHTTSPAASAETPNPSKAPAQGSPATKTLIPTETPTSMPQFNPVLELTGPAISEGLATPGTAIPSPVPTFEAPLNTTNVLLLGNDSGTNIDTIMIVAINRAGPTASILSIPRDTYVYQPGRTMDRINTAYARGGVDLLKQSILYNFGVPIHYYARVDFEGFQEIVNILDGVDIAVSCQLEDWRLKSPDLDPELEESWEIFALEPGIHLMDGDMALWYARSRITTSDFDRGRRQQQLLRAMFTQGVDLGLVTEFPQLWNAYKDYVETDMDVGRMLQLATLAPAIRDNGIQHLYLTNQTTPWITPGGAQVQLPIWEGERMMQETFTRLYLPPALNHGERPPITVEIINATGNPDLTLLAADNLAWHGFAPIFAEDAATIATETTMRYYKPNFKGSFDWLISWIFDLRQSEIELTDDDAFAYDYQVTLGTDYDPCRPQMAAPQTFLTP
jgi:polyisoprenyl-teichoic acid--peptidoglycan teichoic acid transferase